MPGLAQSGSNPFQFSLGWLLGYVTIMALVSAGLLYGRYAAISTYGSGAAQTEWNEWRDDATAMSKGTGPVKRRVPRSTRPPALVLMQDYFLVCFVGALLLSTVLYGTFMVFVRGAFGTAGQFVDRSPPERK